MCNADKIAGKSCDFDWSQDHTANVDSISPSEGSENTLITVTGST